MFRSLLAAAVGLLIPLFAAAQDPAPAESTIFSANDPRAVSGFDENPARTRVMVDTLVCAVTGQADVAKAWRSLVKPEDRVGIKISASGGRVMSTRRGVVAAIVAGLEQAGIPPRNVIVWDRNSADLREAGYLPARERYQVRGIDPPRGYDREAALESPLLGRLVWGDLLFLEKQRVPFGKVRSEDDQLSTTSHLARLLNKDVTKIINVPVLLEHRSCGIAGAIYNMSVPNLDNWRRFLQTQGSISSSPAEAFADERLSGKCVLHIMDGLVAQFAGGPDFEPNYALPHATIYASKDPVALDAEALRKIDSWRAAAKPPLPPATKRGAWVEDAANMGLGNAAANRIQRVAVLLPR